MRFPTLAAAAAMLTLAACGQSATEEEAAPAAPQSLMEQVQVMGPEQQPVFAYQQLAAYQQAHPDSQPPCTAVRGTESRGVIAADVDPETAYAAHVGSLVFSVQCGALRSQTRMDPAEHWLVVFAPGATEATVVSCAGERGADRCPRFTHPAQGAAPAAPAATP